MKSKILILGGGYIGSRLVQELGCPVSTKKILCYEDILAEVKRYQPRVLINCVGHVGRNNVDDCERDMNKSLLANTFLPIWLGEIAFRNVIKLVHISSGCIYHYNYKWQKPIAEEETPDYYTLFYSRTKIYADSVLNSLSQRCNILIVRIRVPLDIYPHPRNILTKLINYKRIIDVPNSITYIPHFLKALRYLIDRDARGTFNVVCKGGLRYPQLLDVYKKYSPGFEYEVIPLKDLKLNRTNLILSTKKLEKTGFEVSKITEVLEECVKKYIKF